MARLTASDHDHLATLGLRVICDFRTPGEREDEPTVWPVGEPPRFVTWDGSFATDDIPLIEALTADDPSPESVREAMADLYRQLPYVLADRYKKMLELLVTGQAPLVFHCSAGKDRTGVAAALILTVLGVPRTTIVEDYCLTDRVVNFFALIDSADPARLAESANAVLLLQPRELLAPILWSHPSYIEAMFDELEATHGSVLGFIRDKLDMSAKEIESLQDLYLE
jgi:protein-tyrosine phosphatase